jgi:hypothetical protein
MKLMQKIEVGTVVQEHIANAIIYIYVVVSIDTIERADSLAGKGKYVTFELLYTEILDKSRTHLGPMYQMSLSRLQTTIENESVWSIL